MYNLASYLQYCLIVVRRRGWGLVQSDNVLWQCAQRLTGHEGLCLSPVMAFLLKMTMKSSAAFHLLCQLCRISATTRFKQSPNYMHLILCLDKPITPDKASRNKTSTIFASLQFPDWVIAVFTSLPHYAALQTVMTSPYWETVAYNMWLHWGALLIKINHYWLRWVW